MARLRDEMQRDVQDNFQEGSAVANGARGLLACTMFFKHEFCTRDDRRAVVAHLRDESSGTRRKAMCSIIFQEGSAVANGARGLLAGTMFFSARVLHER